MKKLNRVESSIGLIAMALVMAMSVGAGAKELAVGSAMPDFKFKDQQGKEQSLAANAGKIIVIDFCSIECPFSVAVDKDLPALTAAYASKGVVLLTICSNAGMSMEKIKEYTTAKKIEHPILRDETGEYARTVGATRTPEFYVVDAKGNLVFHGAFDDRKTPEQKGQTNYVKSALDDLLAGRPVKTPEVPAWGCTIEKNLTPPGLKPAEKK